MEKMEIKYNVNDNDEIKNRKVSENNADKIIKYFYILFISGILISCASKVLNYDKVGPLKKIEEFEQKVQIISQPEPDSVISAKPGAEGEKTLPSSGVAVLPEVKKEDSASIKPTEKEIEKIASDKIKPEKRKKKKVTEKIVPAIIETKHEPLDIEGQDGFIARRPMKDPFKIGERVSHSVTYLGMTAGNLIMEVKPFATVNGKKSYQFQTSIATRSIFDSIYSVDDKSVNLLDFETLIPSVFSLHIRESRQLKEARAYFDRSKGLATYWEKRVTAEDGEKEKKQEWEMPDYSQNVFSSFYYLRTFPWDVGVEHAFRVTDDGKNLIFRGKAVRKERIKTDAGEFNTIVIKPEVQLRGIAQAMGDIFLWLSDDDRKFILKLEAKVKIGYLTSEVTELDVGRD